MDENAPAVALRPPVDVMRPQAVEEIPEQTGTPESLQYSLKLDGFRALAFVLEGGRVFLQSRSQRDLAREFPEIAAYLGEHLPAGTVLDGELCAYRDGRLSFTDLLRSHADRERSGIPVSYVAFDILAVPGRDVRALPLKKRWELLGAALRNSRPAPSARTGDGRRGNRPHLVPRHEGGRRRRNRGEGTALDLSGRGNPDMEKDQAHGHHGRGTPRRLRPVGQTAGTSRPSPG